jgi:putative zincin peptidase
MVVQATRTLPADYTANGSISMKNNRGLMILLNLLGIPWFILSAIFFLFMASQLGSLGARNNPGYSGDFTLSTTTTLIAFLVIVVAFAAVLILHELVHGLFFWLFTRSRPRFGFKGVYAYAAAPGWYIPRPQFLIVGLAPLVLISLAGLIILPFIALPASLVLIIALIVNAAGAIGDLYVVVRLLFAPRSVLIEDQGEGIRWFVPAPRA